MRALPLVARCDEDFGGMHGDDRSRVCETCGVRVHDLSAQSEEEAAEVLASPETKCVRFAVERGGNIRFRAAVVAGAVAVTVAASGIAMASNGNDTPSTPTAGDAGSKDAGADVEHWMGRK